MGGANVMTVTDQDFEAVVLKSDKLVLVDFWATWCGPCMALGPTLEGLASENPGKVVVAKLNVDSSRQVASSYRITSIPTVLFFKGGRLVDSLVGARPKSQYQSIINKNA
jgi:thioredoxin 1